MSALDPFNLHRFITAQDSDYSVVLSELDAGRKETHWIWYIFPQITGLGFSPESQLYSIQDKFEAIAYLNHEVLGSRLIECCNAILKHTDKNIEDILGTTDSMKLRSSMTLFSSVSPATEVFRQILDEFFSGYSDSKTTEILRHQATL
jgi:uncharacterized protein (DUF1810 family)